MLLAPQAPAARGQHVAVVKKLYKRWISTPLGDVEETWRLIEGWSKAMSIELDAAIKTNYQVPRVLCLCFAAVAGLAPCASMQCTKTTRDRERRHVVDGRPCLS